MDASLYLQFSSPAARQTCLYYFDPQTTLPFADEVEEAEARLIEAVEQLPCADAITLSGDSAAYLDLQLDEDEWEAELDGLREFIRGFAPTQLYLYVDTLNEYAAVLRATKKKWKPLYIFGDDEALDDELYALANTQEGWHRRLAHVLAKFS